MQLAMDVAMPVAYALLVANISPDIDRGRLATGAFLLSATLSVMRMPASVLLSERVLGIRNLLAVAGVSRSEYLAANGVSSLYFGLFPLLALAAAALLLHVGVPDRASYWMTLGLFLITLHGLALLLSAGFRSLGAFALTANLLVMVMAVVCPLYFPLERVPSAIRPLVALLPGSLAAQMTRSAAVIPADVVGLVLWALGATALGYLAFPWRRSA